MNNAGEFDCQGARLPWYWVKGPQAAFQWTFPECPQKRRLPEHFMEAYPMFDVLAAAGQHG